MSCWYIKPATLFLYHFHEAKFLILGISQRLWPGLPMDNMCVFGRILVLKLLKMVFSNSLSVGFCISAFSHPSVILLSLPFGTLTTSVDILIYSFIYSFMAVLGLRFCARAFSSCGKRGPLFIVVRGPLTVAASLVAEHRLQTCRLSNCGSRA